MEQFWEIFSILSGPVIGAIIGIFTNYIAVKMLFRPYGEKHIGKWRVPFTPGIIPRRQAALGAALGRMVDETLVRKEDLKSALLSDEVAATVTNAILSLPPLRHAGTALAGDSYEVQRDRALNALTGRIVAGIASLDLAEIFKREGLATINGMSSRNPLLAMFVNEATISSIATPLADRVLLYLEGDGKVKLREILENEVAKLEDKPIGEMFGEREAAEKLIRTVYLRLVNEHADAIVARIHIAGIVEKRVAAMQPRDLENLILTVMKKELNAVIYLGGVIGFVLGIITMLINLI